MLEFSKKKKNSTLYFTDTDVFSVQTIDMEMRKLEVQQSNRHVSLLQSFMADSFMSRGGKVNLP